MSWQVIAEAVTTRLPPEAGAWLREAVAAVVDDPAALGARWSGAGRRLGKTPLAFSDVEAAALRSDGAPFVPQGWGADEGGRAVLLLVAMAGTPAGEQGKLVERLFRTGEMREQQAVLRVLAYLPEPARYTPLAVEAVRTNVLTVIEAVACENPFPAAHVSEEAFNQMVLKCLFNGIALARIEGLEGRRTPELQRMVAGYASERRAAGRPVPADVALILDGGPDAPV